MLKKRNLIFLCLLILEVLLMTSWQKNCPPDNLKIYENKLKYLFYKNTIATVEINKHKKEKFMLLRDFLWKTLFS